jgi:hypothetical protein
MAINCKCCPGDYVHQGAAWRAKVYEGLAADLGPRATRGACEAWFEWYNLGVWFVREGHDRKVWQGWKGANR